MGLWLLWLLFKQQYPVKVVAAGLAHGKTVVVSFIFTFLEFPENDRKMKSDQLFGIFFFSCWNSLFRSFEQFRAWVCVCVYVYILFPVLQERILMLDNTFLSAVYLSYTSGQAIFNRITLYLESLSSLLATLLQVD